MKLRSILTELFDKFQKITWAKRTDVIWKGRFEINSKTYVISMVRDWGVSPNADADFWDAKGDVTAMPWEVSFALVTDDGHKTVDITGTGDAAAVFATVVGGIKEWLNSTKPSLFLLTGVEENRRSLYSKMLKRLLPPNWNTQLDGNTFNCVDKNVELTPETAMLQRASMGADEFEFGYDDYDDYDPYEDL